MSVSCVVGSNSGSGVPDHLGSSPPDAVLTLGDRQTNGSSSSLAVRNAEPSPYNGNAPSLFNSDPCAGNRQEQGIRVNQTLSPNVFSLGGTAISYLGCNTSGNAASWNVTGNVISSSTIFTDPAYSGPIMVPDTSGNTGSIWAKYGCAGTGFSCTSTAPTTAQQSDPNYAAPDISGLTVQSVPSASACSTGNHVVTFTPGIYTDAAAMNSLFGNAACKNATFLFPPVQDASTGDYTSTGLYYFNFQNTTGASYQCGQDYNFFGIITTLQQDTRHEWCVGGAASDYSGQRVVAGAPYNWDPNSDPTTSTLSLTPASTAGDGPSLFYGLIQQHTQFSNPSNAKAIDGSVATYAMSSGHNGSSIWMGGFPSMARGSIGATANIEVAQSATNVAQMNAPTVQINYGTKYDDPFGQKHCGPYTLPKPPADGSIATASLSATDQTLLASCLNTGDAGDRINNGTVAYNVSRISGSPTAKLDGVQIDVQVPNQPNFPRMPSATDNGGDCDPDQPGAEFVFGGDSHIYVPNGGLEVCAGVNSSNPLTGQEIGVYGIPAVPRLVPASNPANTGTITTASNAMQINDGGAGPPLTAGITYGGSMTMRMPSYSVPSGTTITGISLRSGYDSKSSTPSFTIKNTGGTTLCGPTTANTTSGVQDFNFDVTSCLKGSIGNAFDVTWSAGGSSSTACTGATTCPQLDGMQVIISLGLASTSNQNVLIPENGCITASPNYWYGTGSPDCSVLRSDATFSTDLSSRLGRMSIKGTVYAPSAAMDIDDTDVYYPIGGRGIVVRHLRIRGYQAHSGYGTAAFSNEVDKNPADRNVAFLVCQQTSGACTSANAIGRAAVTYDAVTNLPTVQYWSVANN